MRAFALLLLALALACTGGTSSDPVNPEAPPAAPAPLVWDLTEQDGQTLVKAGTSQGLAVGGTVALLGPPLAGTENRQLVGSAKVAEVWPELARVETERVRRDAPPPVAARALLPEDAAAIEALPKLTAGKSAAKPAPAAAATASDELVIPDDLKSGTPNAREDALVRYEGDPNATAAIVWVMKNDPSEEVRIKAWRVVRARWRKGTGNPADHEAAAAWLAKNGGTDQRVEALGAMGDKSRNLSLPGAHLADGDADIRIAAAHAVFDIGERTGKRADAKTMLEQRRDVESASNVKKKLADWIEDL